jgi:acyl carrier protein
MILEKLQKIFERVFSINFPISEKTQREDILTWDSINHLNLIVELEDEFSFSFTPDEIENLKSVSQILQKISIITSKKA